MTNSYSILHPSDAPCRHLARARVGNGDVVPVFLLPVPCHRCYCRFATMMETEAEFVFDRCTDGRAWVCRIPATDDPARGRWHLSVGRRARARDGAAFVVELADETLIVATDGLWSGPGRMLKSRWSQVEVATVRRDLDSWLSARAVIQAEPFYRERFFDYLLPVGIGRWGVPLIEVELIEMYDGVMT